MSIQWTFIAGYLYTEIAIVFILLLPLLSPKQWYYFFHSRLFTNIKRHTSVYFYGLLIILSLFLFDSIREMRKYSHSTEPGHAQLASEMKGNVKLFRSQRNFYITGFAIFLTFVIRRIIPMILIQYELQLNYEQIVKKAEDAMRLTESLARKEASERCANQIESLQDKLDDALQALGKQEIKFIEMEKEAAKWKLKFEENQGKKDGQGDK